jgi:hypothetical protein
MTCYLLQFRIHNKIKFVLIDEANTTQNKFYTGNITVFAGPGIKTWDNNEV